MKKLYCKKCGEEGEMKTCKGCKYEEAMRREMKGEGGFYRPSDYPDGKFPCEECERRGRVILLTPDNYQRKKDD